MSPTVAVSARMLLERCWEGRLRSSRGWIVHIIRLVPHGGQVIYVISVCRLHDHRGVRRWRVSMTFRSTKQTAHSIFYSRGQMCTTTATTAATTTFTGLVHHFVFDHFCSGYRCRYHFVATRLRYKHPNNVHLRCNITHFFFSPSIFLYNELLASLFVVNSTGFRRLACLLFLDALGIKIHVLLTRLRCSVCRQKHQSTDKHKMFSHLFLIVCISK